MNRSVPERRIFALLAILGILVLTTFPLLAQDDQTQEPEATAQVTPGPVEVTYGSGPFNLLAPTVGLADLSSYEVTLTLSFDGTNAGQVAQWTRTYTMLFTQTPPARQLTIETSEDAAAQVVMAEVGNTFYQLRDGNPCVANAVQVERAFAERWEPAGFLYSLIGADEAGAETVDGVATDHYTFDEFAQGAAGIADSTGELWVASDGGYLVRYTLTTTAGPAYFGDGIEGTLSWDYQLSNVNQPLVVQTPDNCPPGTLDLPVLPDAADLVQTPGFTSYRTASSVEEVVAFYEEQVAISGGQAANPPLLIEGNAVYGFTQADQPVLLSAYSTGADTSVQIQRMADPADLAIAAEVPPIVIAPEDTLGHCAAGGVPLPPDATDVTSLPGGLSYVTSMDAEGVTAFYQEQFAGSDVQVSPPMSLSGMVMFDMSKGYHQLSVTLLREGATSRVTVASTTGSPVTPATACAAAGSPPSTCVGPIPLLPDASNVQNLFGSISFTTSTSVADAAAFYEEQVAALGGRVSSPMPASDMMAMLDVTQGDLAVLIMIASGGTVNSVSITSQAGTPLPEPGACKASESDASQSQTQSQAAGAVCTVSTQTSANQRSGPGTEFDLVGALAGGVSAPVDGQATGSDGFIWWRLGEGIWVRSDVVDEAGDCDGVAIVQP